MIVTLPISGNADALRANAWVAQQALAAGVHGILLCHAETPEAAALDGRILPLSVRSQSRGPGAGHPRQWLAGLRISNLGRRPPRVHEHSRCVADESGRRAHVRFEDRIRARPPTSRVPPGAGHRLRGMGPWRSRLLYLMGRPGTYKGGGETSPPMAAVRRRVLEATKAAGVKFLNACNENTVIDQLKEGVMICTGGDTPAADKGRAFTKRTRSLVMTLPGLAFRIPMRRSVRWRDCGYPARWGSLL